MKPLYLRQQRPKPYYSARRIEANFLFATIIVALIILWWILGL